MRRALAISVVIALMIAAACDGFEEGASGDAPDGGDAATLIDAPTADAPLDAAADAATTIPFCSTVDATFCWSFDDDSNGSALYGPRFVKRGGPVSLTDAAHSAPNALYAEGDGASGAWAVETTFNASKRVVCTAAIAFDAISNQTEVITFDVGTGKIAFMANPIDANTLQALLLYDRVGPKLVQGLPNLPLKQWLELTLAAERTDAGLAIAASVLDASVSFDVPDAAVPVFTTLDVELGFYAQYGGAGAVRVDDVRCTYE